MINAVTESPRLSRFSRAVRVGARFGWQLSLLDSCPEETEGGAARESRCQFLGVITRGTADRDKVLGLDFRTYQDTTLTHHCGYKNEILQHHSKQYQQLVMIRQTRHSQKVGTDMILAIIGLVRQAQGSRAKLPRDLPQRADLRK
ncbi:hypothetical protein DPX16_17052 [Anabarilius grahami]|uniref:Uncharacterized protein n=1 Tax=Anabarilius grahami TaxID=495550 RepID=A0A3N0YBH6_ANAGA|nr:hypothetical protein DPX16_17052 [Anabarilius grahami]